MWINVFILLFLSAVAMSTVSAKDFCPGDFAPFYRDHGYALVGHVIATLPLFLPDCMTACKETLTCFSINVYKDQHGGHACELNQANKKQKPGSLVRMTGYEYAEPEIKRFCVKNDCPEKEALPDDWFYFNSSSYKVFMDQKPWHDARQFCQDIGGDLASVSSETEDEFLYKLIVIKTRKTILKKLILDLDTPSKMLSLFNDAKLVTVDDKPSLYLNGINGYATTKNFSMQRTLLTFAVWIKTPNPERTMYVFSDYTDASKAAFRFYIEDNKFVSELYTAANNVLRYVSNSSIPVNTWIHIAFTCSRRSRIGRFYFNGTFDSQSQASAANSTKDLFLTGNSKYYIGQNSAGQNSFTGWIRYMIVLSVILKPDEIREVRDGTFLDGAWIGLNDLTKEKTLQWTDGTPPTFESPTFTLNLNQRDCTVLTKAARGSVWIMEHCHGKAFYICEKKH